MAIESISHRIFNTSTDVWSFGILMWELFSLAHVPYADVASENILIYLQQGQRMLRPIYATHELYELMLACWCVEPERRPSFDELTNSLHNMLPAELALQFVERNKQYVNVTLNSTDGYLKVFSPSAKPNRYLNVYSMTTKPGLSQQSSTNDDDVHDRYPKVLSTAEMSEPTKPPANNESQHSVADQSSTGGVEDLAPTMVESPDTFSDSESRVISTKL